MCLLVCGGFFSIFLIPATTQMTFKHYNPTTKKAVWKSVHASNAKFDKQSCKSDLFVSWSSLSLSTSSH